MKLSLGSTLLSLWDKAPLQTLLLLSAMLLILAHYLQRRKQHLNYPPGPPQLPIVGNLFHMDFKDPVNNMKKLTEKYGNVFWINLGNFQFIFVTGLQLIKEVLNDKDLVFIDRPQLPIQARTFKTLGILFSSGQNWKYQRRFTLMTLRNFGLGKKSLEERIQEEARYLTEAIGEENEQPFDPHFQINNAVSNIICSITFGHRFEYHDAQFRELLHSIDAVSVYQNSWYVQLYNIFPRIMALIPGTHQELFRIWEKLEAFVISVIQQHKEDHNPEDMRDYIDAYLQELSKENLHSSFHEKNLVSCTMDLFIAGTETTSTTLRWALLYMAMNPEIQGKIQAEIDRVVGQSRQPTMADKENLPYTNAAIHEIQRMGNIIPFNAPRMATVDTTLAGYYVPKGTTVITNLSALHRDPKEWATPYTFNPEHFLENGQFKKRESFMPFSTGKRACIGEQLARAELFIFFSCLLQKFTFQAPPNTQLSLDGRLGITLSPAFYKICAIPREIQTI